MDWATWPNLDYQEVGLEFGQLNVQGLSHYTIQPW